MPLTFPTFSNSAGWSGRYQAVLPSSSVSVAGWAPSESTVCPAAMRSQVSAPLSLSASLPSPFTLYSVTTAALVTANFTPVLQSYRSWSPFPLELPTSFLLNQDKVSFLSSSCSWAPVSRSNKTILQKKFKPHFLHLCPRILTHVPKRHCKYNPYCKYLNHYVQILKLHKRLSVMKKIY